MGQKHTQRPNRTHKARWRTWIRGVIFCFEYDPTTQLIWVWKYKSHKRRCVSSTELVEVAEGQRLLSL